MNKKGRDALLGRGEKGAQMRMWAAAALAGAVLGGSFATVAQAADGRSYEMVSPADKNGGDVTGQGTPAVAAGDGNALAYVARASFGDTHGSGAAGQTVYVARRSADGWVTQAITPTPNPDGQMIGVVFDTAIGNFSGDLRHAEVSAYELPAVTGQVPHTNNIYVLDTLTQGLQLASLAPTGPFNAFTFLLDFLSPTFGGVSEDAEHLAFAAASPLTAQAPPGVRSVYEWDNGVVRLASILPDGTPAPNGAMLAPARYRGTISPDGSRVLFMEPPSASTGQLYERVDGQRTVWISQPETSSPTSSPTNVLLQEVTGDSRHVIFTTDSALLDEDTNGSSDIYLYTDSPDPTSDRNLTLITNGGVIPISFGETAVIGSSDDARRIYYYNNGNILLWDNGVTRVVASHVNLSTTPGLQFAATSSSPGAARVTSDGEYLAFMTDGTVADGSGNALTASGNHNQVYLYSEAVDRLTCASCPAQGAAQSDASVVPDVTAMSPASNLVDTRPSFLTKEGKVFFSTADPLVPEDVNGVTDAYMFDPTTGNVSLISTGNGAEPAAFVDASSSGNDVFFVTRQRLVKADRDGFVDVYDARVGGGFPDAPELGAPCVGDVCQGAVSPGVGAIVPGSLSFDGGSSSAATSPLSLRILRIGRGSGRIMVRTQVSQAGTLGWSGAGIRKSARRVGTAGTYKVTLVLTAAGKRSLSRRGTVRSRVRFVFSSAGQRSVTLTVTVAFRRTSSKKGR